MKKLITLALSVLVCFSLTAQRTNVKTSRISSPNGDIDLVVNVSDVISYSVSLKDAPVLSDCVISLDLGSQVLGKAPRLKKSSVSAINETLTPVVPLKFSKVANNCNVLTLAMRDGYSLEFRAYDDGIAYRFLTALKDSVEVFNEEIDVNFAESCTLTVQQSKEFKSSYEEFYKHVDSETYAQTDPMVHYPVLAQTASGKSILMSEADLYDYPAAFFKGNGANGLRAVFPHQPLEVGPESRYAVKILKEADYIAKTAGARSYPWRYFIIVDNDASLPVSTMTCRLSRYSEKEDFTWVKPGKSTWEWWNGHIPYGPDVNFKAGFNTETYKYYVDFAEKFGVEYVIMDGGWCGNYLDPFTPKEGLDVHELVKYADSKGVGIVPWLTWLAVEQNFDKVFDVYSQWGFKGIKIDFMDRSDQWMVNFYERTAKAAAEHHMFIDFHGAFKPAGLEYKYPNVLSYEGVRGLEQMGGCPPDNSLWLPFLRNVTGAMEFTPGGFINMQPDVYRAERPNSGAMGTRAFQMAMFVVFETGFEMMADNVTVYYKNEDCARFISSIPVVWDETRVLQAKAGEYIIVAKRNGDKWYIGAMTCENELTKEYEISLDFLQDGRTYSMTAVSDGINADRQGMDYRMNKSTVSKSQKIKFEMVRNGGFAAIIE